MAKRRGRPLDGWIALDKPDDLTSAQAVARVRKALDADKAGHAGTLDPLATGVLPIALGEATKTMAFAQDSRKVYDFTVRWGIATTTDDREGTESGTSPVRPPAAAIAAALPAFTGQIMQVPPDYSAIKVGGQRAYDLARDQQPVHLTARPVIVEAFEMIEFIDTETARFRVACGKGTYVRALVRDLARALGTLGHITALRRTQCGVFTESSAIPLEKLEALGHSAPASAYLLPIRTVLDDIPALALTPEEAQRLRHGQAVALFPVAQRNPQVALTQGVPVQALLADELVAIAEVGPGMLKPVRVIASPRT
ncbi:MAG: tRNA pseudouridine(55) synthase TruB [Rhodospirillaceae bacterium]|nr:tRNA pseudouridine(55) synthase TruB [Rhodospirillaceae bacterium]